MTGNFSLKCCKMTEKEHTTFFLTGLLTQDFQNQGREKLLQTEKQQKVWNMEISYLVQEEHNKKRF